MITRTALIEAAEEIFLREGFERASVGQITEAAGFSRGAFYSNFREKDELALAVIDKRRGEVADALRTLHRIADPAERQASIRAWFSQQCRQAEWISLRLEFSRRARRNSTLDEVLAELCRQEIKTCADPVAWNSPLASGDPAISAAALIAACHGLGSLGFDAAPDLDRIRDAAARLIIDRLLTAPANRDPVQEGAQS